MTGISHRIVTRAAIAAGLALGLTTSLPQPASAAPSERMRTACTSDYLKFCGQYDPDGPQTISCMKKNGNRLSRTCRSVVEAEGIPSGGSRRR